MKKKLLLVITLLTSIFFFSFSAQALTKINFQEKSNGHIDTTLHFEEGFVGGIDITFNITGNVKVKEFSFSDKITSGNYNKEYEYDQKNNSLVVRVTTGGIGASHNLLNDKKELVLGTIVLESSEKEDVTYKLSEKEFKIVGNYWEPQVIAQENITLGDNTEFVFKAEVINEPEEDKPGDEDNKDTDGDNPQDNTDNEDENKPSDSTEVDPSDSDDKQGDDKNEDDKDNTDKNDQVDKEEQEDKEDQENNSKEEAEDNKVEEENNTITWIILGIAGVVFIACVVWFGLVNRKKRLGN